MENEQEFGSAAELGEALEAHLAALERKALWIEAAWNRPGAVARRLAHLVWLGIVGFFTGHDSDSPSL